ncbi:MAG TPA: hypothetical protein VKY65_07115 [Alphaproteobacteria bacterium]|nr:hypothetical protein [Alphaproteobacteria bacterium]
MSHRNARSAWALVALLLVLLGVVSAIAGAPKLPSQDELMRAYVRTPHERLSMA